MNRIILWLKVSRPGLWFATIWLYMLPTAQMDNIWNSYTFWVGLIYVSFPLNFLVYGWNDIVDHNADMHNPRKDSFLFGAKANKKTLANLWKPLLGVQLVCLPFIIFMASWKFILLMIPFLLINHLYNLPENGLRSRPPLELLCQIAYLLVVPFSILINETTNLPWVTYFYLILFAWQSHLIGEVMDIEPDKKAKKHTTATFLGMKKTKMIIIMIVSIEVLLLFLVFKDFIFGSMLAIGLLWLILDLYFIYKTKEYTLSQMKFFGYSSNIIALMSMIYVWYSSCLLSLPN